MTTNTTPERDRLITDAIRAFADREVDLPTIEQLGIALDAYEATLTRCTCPECTQGRRDRTGLTDHDRTALARVLHGIVYSPGGNFDRAVPGIQEYMLACADKVAAALPWVVPTPEVTLEVGELPIVTRAALVSAIMNAPESGDAVHVAEVERIADAVLSLIEGVLEVIDDEPCNAEIWSWDIFRHQQVDPYWMRCHRVGKHDEHENSETGAKWPVTAGRRGA